MYVILKFIWHLDVEGWTGTLTDASNDLFAVLSMIA